MDASVVYGYVCVDASGIGVVLDRIEFIWNIANVYNQKNNKIKMPIWHFYFMYLNNASGV